MSPNFGERLAVGTTAEKSCGQLPTWCRRRKAPIKQKALDSKQVTTRIQRLVANQAGHTWIGGRWRLSATSLVEGSYAGGVPRQRPLSVQLQV